MQQARLIPVSGIGSVTEAEQRATSAMLAVLTVVRDLSIELLSPLGASKAQRATVEAFTEVIFPHDGKKIRPDGLITVTYGQSTWSTLVEVKTGTNALEADQLNRYWDIARTNGVDHVLTISNEIAPNEATHPTPGLKVRSNSKVPVSHLSWTAILASAVRLKQHAGVDDPEQAWILGELIRYLEHPQSGALNFDDMGPNWVAVRDGARASSLNKRTDGLEDVCARWDQLLRYAALRLGSQIGEDVVHLLSKAHRDVRQRHAYLVDSLCESGVVDGTLRVPNTAGDLVVTADLRAQQLTVAIDVPAPQNRGARGRVSWLVNQLKNAPGGLVIEAYARNARTPVIATLSEALEDRMFLLDDQKRDPHKFRIVGRATMGAGRKAGKKTAGFIDTTLALMDDFYQTVVQTLTPWQPPAPKLKPSVSPGEVTPSPWRPTAPEDESVAD